MPNRATAAKNETQWNKHNELKQFNEFAEFEQLQRARCTGSLAVIQEVESHWFKAAK